MNIYCEKIIEHMENSEDDYMGYIHKTMILQVTEQIFRERIIGGRMFLTVICFSESLISGQVFKMILQIMKGYFNKWCQRNPLQ